MTELVGVGENGGFGCRDNGKTPTLRCGGHAIFSPHPNPHLPTKRKKSRKNPTIRILNPPPGHATYTTLKKARLLEARGIAEIVNGGVRLFPEAALLSTLAQEERFRQQRRAQALEEEITRMRDGSFSWSGNRGSEKHFPPGVVRS